MWHQISGALLEYIAKRAMWVVVMGLVLTGACFAGSMWITNQSGRSHLPLIRPDVSPREGPQVKPGMHWRPHH